MPKVGGGHKAPKNPNVGPGKKPNKNPNVGPGKALPKKGGKGKKAGKGGPEEYFDPGVATPTVQPFLTADDLMAYAQARKEYEEGLSLLDRELAETGTNTNYEQAELKRNAVKGKVDMSDEYAGRGLFKSSVRDADLFDIDATAELKRQFLDTKLNTTKLNVESRKRALQDWWSNPQTGFLHNLDLKKIENAQLASEGLPPWIIEPGMKQVPQAGPVNKQKGPNKQPKFAVNKPIRHPVKAPSTRTGGTQYPGKGGGGGMSAGPPSRPKRGLQGGQKVKGKLA